MNIYLEDDDGRYFFFRCSYLSCTPFILIGDLVVLSSIEENVYFPREHHFLPGTRGDSNYVRYPNSCHAYPFPRVEYNSLITNRPSG